MYNLALIFTFWAILDIMREMEVEGWTLSPSLSLPPLKRTRRQRVLSVVLRSTAASSSASTSSSATRSRPPSHVILPDTSTPLPPHTFGGMVERCLLDKFGTVAIERIIQSWRLLDKEYYHEQYVGSDDDDDGSGNDDDHDDSNNPRPLMIQECHSYVPGLSIKPFWDKSHFEWARHLESHYEEIRQEFQQVTSNLSELKSQGNNIWAGALTDDASSYGVGWKTLVLMDRGRWDPINTKLFPVTARAVFDSKVPVTEVFFASMEPNTSIKTHTDFTNFVLTSHLPIDIPYSGENKCRLTIGNDTRQWLNGQIMVFDTSLQHDAINESDKTRYILMMRLWHPDLTEAERQALQFTFDALEIDGLVGPDENQRYNAEQTAEILRKFPLLDDESNKKGGFGMTSNNGSRKGGGSSKKNKMNKNIKTSKGFGR